MKNAPTKTPKIAYLLVIAGLIAFVFAFIIMAEKVWILEDPTRIPPCSIDAIFSCKSVMESPQANAFGFPNPFLGIAGFSIITTIGFAMLAGARFKRWFWIATQLGLTFALGFIYWLFYAAVFEINALCLYCMAVWAMTIPLFLYTLRYNLREGHFSSSGKSIQLKFAPLILILMYAIIVVPIFIKF